MKIRAFAALCGALFMAGCGSEPLDFEHFNGPLSPPGMAMVASGALRETLFPGSGQAFTVCIEDPAACTSAGGITLQVTPAGRATLDYLKIMIALQLDGAPQACEAFASQLFRERKTDAYEVSMRLLGFFTADAESPLSCAVRALDREFGGQTNRFVHWDSIKLIAYAEATIKARLAQAIAEGARGKHARLGDAFSLLKPMNFRAWAASSNVYYFVGKFNFTRKHIPPSTNLANFRAKLEGIFGTFPVESQTQSR